ncbi:NETI motif-containing protein [Gracilibacillus caseinilyticus]|uniref:NETI motif-containing protein n=1 Tax=Gracilibacillus caseinilyticus TaxID=2932256 RepID=A0ABY4EX67_9BACI|nr:NETI motif-containing protein [Gracilibacillus caseinilyticus]UOQ49014.1 NETI motif-containing protein [Gracilibacillus caseinilyticus]
MKFSVEEGESIEACLERIRQAGYVPTRRVEQPVFTEENGEPVPSGRTIVFDAKSAKSEH